MGFIVNMINNNYPQISFGRKVKLPQKLNEVRTVFQREFSEVESPTHYRRLIPENIEVAKLNELENKLRFVRAFSKTLIPDEGLPGFFRGIIGFMQSFKVANCDEYAEVGKTVLKMNGVKDCDMFRLYAKGADGSVRDLDHEIVAVGISKSKNNYGKKKKGEMFEPRKGAMIFDMWLNGFIGKVKNSRKAYRQIGLKDDEKLMFRPVNTYEADKEILTSLREKFPKLVVANN